MIDGVTELIMMKADVLDDFDSIEVCTGYKVNGQVTEDFPYELDGDVVPVYETLPGWKKTLTGVTSEKDFPVELSNYIRFIEAKLQVPVSIVSVGPNRSQTIER
jgi:adenylosuccinate synthase